MFRPVAWRESDECDLSFCCRTYSEAEELGREVYPDGFDVEDSDDVEFEED